MAFGRWRGQLCPPNLGSGVPPWFSSQMMGVTLWSSSSRRVFTWARHHLRGFWGGGCSKDQHRQVLIRRPHRPQGEGPQRPPKEYRMPLVLSPQVRLASTGIRIQLFFLRKCSVSSAGRRRGGDLDVVEALAFCFQIPLVLPAEQAFSALVLSGLEHSLLWGLPRAL